MTDKPVLHMTCNHDTGIISAQQELFDVIYDFNMCGSCLQKMKKDAVMIKATETECEHGNECDCNWQDLENKTKPVLSKAHFPTKDKRQLLDFDGSNKGTTICAFKGVIGLELQAAYNYTTVRIHLTKTQTIPVIRYAIATLGITPKDLELTA